MHTPNIVRYTSGVQMVQQICTIFNRARYLQSAHEELKNINNKKKYKLVFEGRTCFEFTSTFQKMKIS